MSPTEFLDTTCGFCKQARNRCQCNWGMICSMCGLGDRECKCKEKLGTPALPERDPSGLQGWVCPNCGAGMNPSANRCGCIDVNKITC